VVPAGVDDTGQIAHDLGAQVFDETELLPDAGPVLGKGDAMWRGVSAARGDVVCFVDGDTTGFGEHFVVGPVGPILDGSAALTKACFRRPFTTPSGEELQAGGGRVTELMARPLLRALWPELAGLRQPLAGEVAAMRSLLLELPFSVGYAVETAMLLDVYQRCGADAIAEVDLDVRRNAHQSLTALSNMADEVLAAALSRVAGVQAVAAPVERPPLRARRPLASAA
ncbi:MAG: glucosyl-3-phosphoglycerate synthase, partial [Solirubrobacteraceae bacterium]|nr:glucosyl-3-phosphoglycerate synthase [Solirubrobacteraceae bacterium]